MPGTSVGVPPPPRLAMRRVTRRVYSSSSLVPTIICRTIPTAAMRMEASSAQPNESTWMSSGSTSWASTSMTASTSSTRMNPIASM